MKAAVLYKYNSPLKIQDLELDEPAAGEIMVKMMASGVCHSDWHVFKGDWGHIPLPTVLGHEGAGIVEAVGPKVTTIVPGDHVVLSWKAGCGKCEMCQIGRPNVCENPLWPKSNPRVVKTGVEINQMGGLGTFGSYTVVQESAAIPIDRDVPFSQAALVGCGVTTGVGAVINTACVQAGTTVAVFGCGGVGLNCIQGAVIAGATTIIAVDMLDNRLELARRFGATHTVNASSDEPVERIREMTGGKGVHYAFEAIGVADRPFIQSIECTRSRGVTVWVGHAPDDLLLTISARALLMEKTIIGSLYGSARPRIDFPRLLGLYKAKKLRLDELVTREFPVEDTDRAFEELAKGGGVRSVLTFH